MKKLCAIFAALMTAATVVLLLACGGDPMQNVSERRSGFFSGVADGFTINAVSGVRETPYAIDGRAGELKPYTLVTVVPDKFDADAILSYTAEFGGAAYGGALTAHPFGASYSAEFDAETDRDFTVTVVCGGKSVTAELKSIVPGDSYSYDRAISEAKRCFELDFEYEIRARLIKNPIEDGGVCWHVAFYGAENECGVLLDPVSAKVLAKKEKR